MIKADPMRSKRLVTKTKEPPNEFPNLKTALDQIHIEVDRSLFLHERNDIASMQEAIDIHAEISARLLSAIEWIRHIEKLMRGITNLS